MSKENKLLGDIAELNSKAIRFNKFKALLDSPMVDLEQLKKLSWMGIPEEIRPTVWKILMVGKSYCDCMKLIGINRDQIQLRNVQCVIF
jgi:hypothetical protein